MLYIYMKSALFILCLLNLIILYYFFYKNHKVIQKKKQVQRSNLNESALFGKKAPDFKLESVQGKFHNLSSILNNGVLLIFIDNVCPYCQSHFESFFNQVKNTKINFVLIINGRDEPSDKYANDFNNLYEGQFIILKGNKEIASVYQINSLPTYIHINQNMIIDYISGSTFQTIQNILGKKSF
ncbi:redoxin domain-containing protein [Aneurinibacillus aneurinilyticus]|uniref:peroxiredoxin family protein n=1 Tax=Aneurinibacillus aneurinilyticus TaxID=1391 RepID=UPI002E1D0CF3|nr:redoxin domain-containing protein [Aneurinibacillus aneurinilyticus]MED0670462.1 redoxin domain-containing protein [Aneurinibacillus aneurinilyticus]